MISGLYLKKFNSGLTADIRGTGGFLYCIPLHLRIQKKSLRRFLLILLLFLYAVLFLSSCISLPEGPYPDIINWLPEDSDLIIRLDVRGNPELTSYIINYAGLDDESVSKVKKRTALVALGIEFDKELSGVLTDKEELKMIPFHLAAIGDWPRNFLGGALGKEWKKSSLNRYRWQGPDNLELMALSSTELILSRGKIDKMLERLNKGTISRKIQRAYDIKNGADLAIWVTDPSFIIKAVPMLPDVNPDGTPVIDLISIALRHVEESKYVLAFTLYPSDERLSGSLALALRLALSAKFGLSPKPEERELLSEMLVEIGKGDVRLVLPSVEFSVLTSFLDDLKLFPEGGSE